MRSEKYLSINRRISDRKNYLKDIFFSVGPMVYHGKCKNISTGGVLIGNTSLLNIKSGNQILIAIPFPKGHSSVKKKATVRWAVNNEFGVQFHRRKDIRKNYNNKVTVLTESAIIPARINNLSKGGANIVSNKRFFLNTKSEIYVIIPFAKRKNEITLRSVVKWIKDSKIGIQFV